MSTPSPPLARMPYGTYCSTDNVLRGSARYEHSNETERDLRRREENIRDATETYRDLRRREENIRDATETNRTKFHELNEWQARLEKKSLALAGVDDVLGKAEELKRFESDLERREVALRERESQIRSVVCAAQKEKQLREWEKRLATTENDLQRERVELHCSKSQILSEQQRRATEFEDRVRVERERIERDNEKHIKSRVDNLTNRRVKYERKRYEKEKFIHAQEQVEKALALAAQQSVSTIEERVRAEIDTQFALKRDELVAIELQRRLNEAEQQQQQQQSQSLCVVCAEREISWMFKPCNHVATCADCTTKIFQSHKESTCPICKAVIEEIERVFLPS